MSDAQQFEHFLDHHPVGKAFRQTCAQHGLDDTQGELAKEYGLEDVHDHERRKHPNDGENPAATKNMSTVLNAALDKAANELLAKARKDRVAGATYARIYEHIITKTQWGRSIASLEKLSRIGVA
jgi:hypothetical protein